MRNSSRGNRQRRAVATIWVAATMLTTIAIIGVAMDVGYTLLVGNQLQNAADASSLAAARVVRDDQDDARLTAVDIALANLAAKAPVQVGSNDANSPSGDLVIGRWSQTDRTFTPTTSFPNAVKVLAKRTTTSLGGPLPTLFGKAFGVDTVDVSRSATAMIGGGTGAGIIALCTDCECALTVNGNVAIDVEGAPIQVNSDLECGTCTSGGALFIDAPSINTPGGVCSSGNPDIPDVVDSPSVDDPLAFVPPPPWDPLADHGTFVQNDSGAVTVLNSGFYSGGISQNGGQLTLNPGNYILDGVGIDIQGNSTFIAEDVMLYITGTGVVDIAGTGLTRITPQGPAAYPWEGISIFQARAPGGTFGENGACGDSRIIGTSLLDLDGTLYFPCAFLEVGGTGDGFGNQLVAWQMWVHGNGELTLNYNGSQVAPGNSVFLVQ